MSLLSHSAQNKRLLGVDLFRGVSAYGVVLIHGLGELPRDEQALMISNFFVAFCVPYFLVASFYFSSHLLLYKKPKNYLSSRIKRILVPYAIWSLIYFLARCLGYLIGNKESLQRLISDPVNIIFFGAAGVHLYFLPMLFCGTVVAILMVKICRRFSLPFLMNFFLVSLSIFYVMNVSGNDFILGEGIAFKQAFFLQFNYSFSQMFRVILVILAWTIKCMPYIIFGIIINSPRIQQLLYSFSLNEQNITRGKLLIIFFTPLAIISIFLCHSDILNLLIPYLSFLYSIWISGLISQNQTMTHIAKKLGYLSYGIYLSHALITAGFLPIMTKLYPQIVSFQLSPLILIISSLVIFLISLAIAHLFSLHQTTARILLAV
jgi:hypothetical protein